jgi:hypothetical protein
MSHAFYWLSAVGHLAQPNTARLLRFPAPLPLRPVAADTRTKFSFFFFGFVSRGKLLEIERLFLILFFDRPFL